ncbi:hypothetical protein [Streptomyces sp. NBC_00989]|uniref:hypothetical protein n=1 Tax=Streptomyces sp. NBC_00989 TaxID=2903705 RepID=UPI00386EA41E|nr:hypothetical protein OG714_53070 [Streptomyces sp. NBC_00989]
MPSVLGMLEAREKKFREEVARLREEADRVQAALVAAEGALVKLAAARETVAEVLGEQAGPPGRDTELRRRRSPEPGRNRTTPTPLSASTRRFPRSGRSPTRRFRPELQANHHKEKAS